MKKSYRALGKVLLYTVLIAFAVVFLLPFIWMISASLKLPREVFVWPIEWVPRVLHFENYPLVFEEVPFGLYFWNTAKLTVWTVVIQLFTSSFAAYGFAKIHFRGRNIAFIGYIATLAIPFQIYMVPQYILMARMGLVNSHFGLILQSAFTPFGVFLLRQFTAEIPDSLCEAARIDGMSEYGIYARIVLPLVKPALATLTLSTFIFVWNDFFRSLIYLDSPKLKTLQLGIREFITAYSSDYNMICAASLIALLPVFILFLSMQKQFVEGIATTGMKN